MIVKQVPTPFINFNELVVRINGDEKEWTRFCPIDGGPRNKYVYYDENDVVMFVIDLNTIIILDENLGLDEGYYVLDVSDGAVKGGFDFYVTDVYANIPDIEDVVTGTQCIVTTVDSSLHVLFPGFFRLLREKNFDVTCISA